MRISIEQASELLKAGNVVAVPTETVYGLAASIKCPAAIAEIFSLKGRPSNNPLIIHLSSVQELDEYVKEVPDEVLQLATAFWPGPLTIVLPVIMKQVPEIVRAGLPTAAFRVPSHPLARELLVSTGPLVMPSANLSGKPSSTSFKHVEEDFGSHFPVLDGGECMRGVESTILYWRDGIWTIIRLGALAPEEFIPILGYKPEIWMDEGEQTAPLCPGQLYRHYAPQTHLILAKTIPENPVGFVIGFSDRRYPYGMQLLSLGVSSDPITASQRLYSLLRQLDQEGIKRAYVDIDFPDEGLWLTLRERLQKAAGSQS